MSNMGYRIVPGFSRYKISYCGKSVVDMNTGNMISQVKSGIPQYLYVNAFNDEGKRKLVRVHRLVAMAWKSKPTGLEYVDHIDRNKFNNHMDNLRWVDRKGNARNISNNRYYGQELLVDKLDRCVKDWSTPLYQKCLKGLDEGICVEESIVKYMGFLVYGIKSNGFNRVVDGKYLIQTLKGGRELYQTVCTNLDKGWSYWNALHNVPSHVAGSLEVVDPKSGVGIWFRNKNQILEHVSNRVGSSVGEISYQNQKHNLPYFVFKWHPDDNLNKYVINYEGSVVTGTAREISTITGLSTDLIRWHSGKPPSNQKKRIRTYLFDGEFVTRKYILEYFGFNSKIKGAKMSEKKLSLRELLIEEGVDISGYEISPVTL